MNLSHNVSEIIREQVTLAVESIDRMYLNVYQPQLQRDLGVVGFFRYHRGQAFASSVLMAEMTRTFVARLEAFAKAQEIPLITFQKGQRKDDIAKSYRAKFSKAEGVVFIGKAQEKAAVWRTEKRYHQESGTTYPWLVRSTAMVNHYYLYIQDRDFGPFFIKFCSYFPYSAKLCLNGHEYAKQQLKQKGIEFSRSTMAFSLVLTHAVCSVPARDCRQRRSTNYCANGCACCRILSLKQIGRRVGFTIFRSCKLSSL